MKYSYSGNHGYQADLVAQGRSLMDDLLGERDSYIQKRKAIETSNYYSDLEKRHHLTVLRREAPERARAAATALWRHFEPSLDLIDRAIKRAAKDAPSFDYAKLAYLRAEFEARLKDAGNPVFGLPGRLERIAAMRQEATEHGDLHALRALRLAAEPYVQHPNDEPDAYAVAKAGDLRRAFAQDAEDEVPGDVRLLEAERGELLRLQAEADRAIDSAELTLFPEQQRRIFRPLTDWDKEIRGLTYEAIGAIAWSPAAKAAAAAQAAEHGPIVEKPAGNIFDPEYARQHGGGVLFEPEINPKQRMEDKGDFWD